MKLTSMKIDQAAQKAKYASVAQDEPDRPMYPWGMTIRLDTEALEKMGLADKLPEVGKGMKLEALVDVVSVSESDTQGGGKNCNVELQITDLGLKAVADTDAGDTLYKGK